VAFGHFAQKSTTTKTRLTKALCGVIEYFLIKTTWPQAINIQLNLRALLLYVFPVVPVGSKQIGFHPQGVWFQIFNVVSGWKNHIGKGSVSRYSSPSVQFINKNLHHALLCRVVQIQVRL